MADLLIKNSIRERSTTYVVPMRAIVKFEIRGSFQEGNFSLIMYTIDEHAVILYFDEEETGAFVNSLLDELVDAIKEDQSDYDLASRAEALALKMNRRNTYRTFEVRRAKLITKKKLN